RSGMVVIVLPDSAGWLLGIRTAKPQAPAAFDQACAPPASLREKAFARFCSYIKASAFPSKPSISDPVAEPHEMIPMLKDKRYRRFGAALQASRCCCTLR